MDRVDERPQVRDDLAVVELDGEAVIYDERNGDLHRLNPTATVVFSLLDGSATLEELARDLGEAYSIPVVELEEQLRTLVVRFGRSHLLVGTEPETSERDVDGD
ncbi:MAG TPA: HPr-rel-A system PqqD family peptide chaperone [Actinomycetota bacterium]|jgi:PqqD family protein of HPr-rel-A system|nr:HPr-rel-A system PqqD family peptide chaperone [Actinomycetota bacterium]